MKNGSGVPNRVSRRQFLQTAAGVAGSALAGSLLVACGSEQKPAPVPTSAPAKAAAPAAASSPIEDLVAAAKKEGVLSLYSGWTDQDNKVAADLFTAKYGIDVQIYRAVAGQVLQKFDLEVKAGDVKADVIIMGDDVSSLELQKQGRLMEYVPPSAQEAAFNKKYVGTHYHNVGMTIWPFAWNSDRVKGADAPTEYKDFLKPIWKGRMGLLDAATSLIGIQYYYLIRKMMGVDYMKELGAQKFRLLTPNNAIAEQVVSGELYGCPAMILNVIEQFVNKKAPIEWKLAKPATPVLTRAAQIPAKAPHPSTAKLFLNYLTSKEGQEQINKTTRTISPRTDVKVEGVPVEGTFASIRVEDMDEFTRMRDELGNEFNKFFKV